MKYPITFIGNKNCYDCRHLKVKIPIKKCGLTKKYGWAGLYLSFGDRLIRARCVKKNLIKEDIKCKLLGTRDCNPETCLDLACLASFDIKWDKLNAGWRNSQWSYANICSDFSSINDEIEDENELEKEDSIKEVLMESIRF